MTSVLILGSGAAGLSAAFLASKRGAKVTLVNAGLGATAMGGGAVDDVPWENVEGMTGSGLTKVPPRHQAILDEFLSSLRLWQFPNECVLATASGRLRNARGHDASLLNLAELHECTVLIPGCNRRGWDAAGLSRALAAEPYAKKHGIAFDVFDVNVLKFVEEARCADAELAARHDDDARLRWLSARLMEQLQRRPNAGAILMGSWLGVSAPRAQALSQMLNVRVGEILQAVGGAAGLRFESARDRLLRGLGVRVIQGRATQILESPELEGVKLEDGQILSADRIVLAIGGLSGGGIEYVPPDSIATEDLPPGVPEAFRLSVRINARLLAGGETLERASSLFGPELDGAAWPRGSQQGLLEDVGVATRGSLVCPGVYAAGDVMGGRPRTLLSAILSGFDAAEGI